MANISSQLVRAQAENKASDYSAATAVGLFWINTSTSLIKFDDGSAVRTVVTTDNTQTLTNKTLTGNIAVNLVSGSATVTLPTTTSTLATLDLAETLSNKTICGLSFTTFAKGDILYASAANTLARLAIGSNGQTLKVATDVPAWQSSANSSSIVTKTADYTLTSNDDVVLANADGASSFTLTLPAAASNSGKVYRIKKTGSDITKTITIDGNASETVDGSTTYILYTLDEEVEIVCDGSNWILLNHRTITPWTTFTPVCNSTTNTTNTGKWQRNGDTVTVLTKVAFSGTPDNVNFTIDTPSNISIDTTKNVTTSAVALGNCTIRASSALSSGECLYNSTTQIAIYSYNSGTTVLGVVTRTFPGTLGSGDFIWVKYSFPVSGWNP